jgi:hypothetical protein
LPGFWQRRDRKSRWNQIYLAVAIFEAEPERITDGLVFRHVLGGYQQLPRADFLPRVLSEMASVAAADKAGLGLLVEPTGELLLSKVAAAALSTPSWVQQRPIPPSGASRAAIPGHFKAFPDVYPMFTIAAKLGRSGRIGVRCAGNGTG